MLEDRVSEDGTLDGRASRGETLEGSASEREALDDGASEAETLENRALEGRMPKSRAPLDAVLPRSARPPNPPVFSVARNSMAEAKIAPAIRGSTNVFTMPSAMTMPLKGTTLGEYRGIVTKNATNASRRMAYASGFPGCSSMRSFFRDKDHAESVLLRRFQAGS